MKITRKQLNNIIKQSLVENNLNEGYFSDLYGNIKDRLFGSEENDEEYLPTDPGVPQPPPEPVESPEVTQQKEKLKKLSTLAKNGSASYHNQVDLILDSLGDEELVQEFGKTAIGKVHKAVMLLIRDFEDYLKEVKSTGTERDGPRGETYEFVCMPDNSDPNYDILRPRVIWKSWGKKNENKPEMAAAQAIDPDDFTGSMDFNPGFYYTLTKPHILSHHLERVAQDLEKNSMFRVKKGSFALR